MQRHTAQRLGAALVLSTSCSLGNDPGSAYVPKASIQMEQAFTQDEFFKVFGQFMPAQQATKTAREFSAPLSAGVNFGVESAGDGLSFSVEPTDHYSRDLLVLLARVSPATAEKVERIRSRLALDGDPEFQTASWLRRQTEIDNWFSSNATTPVLRWTSPNEG